MRPILLIVAAVATFFVWDGLANKSAYLIATVNSLEQVVTSPGPIKTGA